MGWICGKTQLTALKEAGCGHIFQEKISGAKRERPELQRLLYQLRPEDIVVVWKLDRLARSTHQLLELVTSIQVAKASFLSLSEPWADTTTPGRVAAHRRGVRFGRPEKMNEEQKLLAKRLLQEQKSVSEVAKTLCLTKFLS